MAATVGQGNAIISWHLCFLLLLPYYKICAIVQIGQCSDGTPAILPCDQESKVCVGNPRMGCERHGPAYFCCGILLDGASPPPAGIPTQNASQPRNPSAIQDCEDKFKQCEHWARRGLCFMGMYNSQTKAKLCPKSCKLCHLVPPPENGGGKGGRAQEMPQIQGSAANNNDHPPNGDFPKLAVNPKDAGREGGMGRMPDYVPNLNGTNRPVGINGHGQNGRMDGPRLIPSADGPKNESIANGGATIPNAASTPPADHAILSSSTAPPGLISSLWSKLTGGDGAKQPSGESAGGSSTAPSRRPPSPPPTTLQASGLAGNFGNFGGAIWSKLTGSNDAAASSSTPFSADGMGKMVDMVANMMSSTIDPSWYDGFDDINETMKGVDWDWGLGDPWEALGAEPPPNSGKSTLGGNSPASTNTRPSLSSSSSSSSPSSSPLPSTASKSVVNMTERPRNVKKPRKLRPEEGELIHEEKEEKERKRKKKKEEERKKKGKNEVKGRKKDAEEEKGKKTIKGKKKKDGREGEKKKKGTKGKKRKNEEEEEDYDADDYRGEVVDDYYDEADDYYEEEEERNDGEESRRRKNNNNYWEEFRRGMHGMRDEVRDGRRNNWAQQFKKGMMHSLLLMEEGANDRRR